MPGEERRLAPQELGAFGVGLAVTIVSSLLASPMIPFPFNFLISFGLGGTAMYGARKLLDPRTAAEVIEQRTENEYREILSEIAEVGKRVEDGSRNPSVEDETSRHLASIAKMIDMILKRYQERGRDFAGASSTLYILREFDGILSDYLKIKGGELFLDKRKMKEEITRIEGRDIPMVERALEKLGMKLDSGEILGREISKGTLESMLSSLGLVETLKEQLDSAGVGKEGSNDAQ